MSSPAARRCEAPSGAGVFLCGFAEKRPAAAAEYRVQASACAQHHEPYSFVKFLDAVRLHDDECAGAHCLGDCFHCFSLQEKPTRESARDLPLTGKARSLHLGGPAPRWQSTASLHTAVSAAASGRQVRHSFCTCKTMVHRTRTRVYSGMCCTPVMYGIRHSRLPTAAPRVMAPRSQQPRECC